MTPGQTGLDMPLIDRTQLGRARARALRLGGPHFLFDRAAEDLCLRIGAVNRVFKRGVDVSVRCGVLGHRLVEAGRLDQVWHAAPSGIAPQPEAAVADIHFDEEWIPLAQESVDLVVSALVLHTVNDLPGALIQLNRSLRPDGLFVANLVGGNSLNELRNALAIAEAEIRGGAAPRVLPFCDVRTAGQLLQRAGFSLPVADLDRFAVRYDSALDLMRDLRLMGETNVLSARDRTPLTRRFLMRLAQVYSELYSDPDGRVRATFDIVTMTGWKPDASQQRPLRPGSARARLADALNTSEQSAGEPAGRAIPLGGKAD